MSACMLYAPGLVSMEIRSLELALAMVMSHCVGGSWEGNKGLLGKQRVLLEQVAYFISSMFTNVDTDSAWNSMPGVV